MILTIGMFFPDPDREFNISSRILNLVREELKASILIPNDLDKKDPNYQLSLIVCTAADVNQTMIKGPDVNKRERTITWGLWLPYEIIAANNDQRAEFLNQLFNALVMVFEKYAVPEANVRNLGLKVVAKVLGSDDYRRKERNIRE